MPRRSRLSKQVWSDYLGDSVTDQVCQMHDDSNDLNHFVQKCMGVLEAVANDVDFPQLSEFAAAVKSGSQRITNEFDQDDEDEEEDEECSGCEEYEDQLKETRRKLNELYVERKSLRQENDSLSTNLDHLRVAIADLKTRLSNYQYSERLQQDKTDSLSAKVKGLQIEVDLVRQESVALKVCEISNHQVRLQEAEARQQLPATTGLPDAAQSSGTRSSQMSYLDVGSLADNLSQSGNDDESLG